MVRFAAHDVSLTPSGRTVASAAVIRDGVSGHGVRTSPSCATAPGGHTVAFPPERGGDMGEGITSTLKSRINHIDPARVTRMRGTTTRSRPTTWLRAIARRS